MLALVLQRLAAPLTVGILLLISGLSAIALSENDSRDCATYSAAPELRIQACKRILADSSISTRVRASAHTKLGEAYIMNRDYADALTEYEMAIESDSNNWEAYNGRGVVFSKMGQYDRAFADYDKATELNPTHPWPWINRCEDNVKIDRLKEAGVQCEKLLELWCSQSKTWKVRHGDHRF